MLLWEHPHPGLRNESPLDSLDPQSLNPLMASLWIGSGEGLAIKGFGDWGSRLSSGDSFWSPGWGRSRSSLEIHWIFFAISISQKVRCLVWIAFLEIRMLFSKRWKNGLDNILGYISYTTLSIYYLLRFTKVATFYLARPFPADVS